MISRGLPIYVALEPLDMRMGYERLGGQVRERMRAEPRSKALFVFVGKRGHTMKVPTWDGRSLRKIVVVVKIGCSTAATLTPRAPPPSSASSLRVRLHSIGPQQYLDEVTRVLPYWPKHRHLELASKYWQATRTNLDPAEVDAQLCPITVPQVALNFAR